LKNIDFSNNNLNTQKIKNLNNANSNNIYPEEDIVRGDGNCMAYAILKTCGLSTDYHPVLRQRIVEELQAPINEQERIVIESYLEYDPDYIQNMSKNNVYMTNLELSILSKRTAIAFIIIRKDIKFVNNELLFNFWEEYIYLESMPLYFMSLSISSNSLAFSDNIYS
jgi:hypothetical protein